MLTNGVISLCDGRRTDVWDVTGIWAHSVTGRFMSHRYGNAGIDTSHLVKALHMFKYLNSHNDRNLAFNPEISELSDPLKIDRKSNR